MAPGIPFVKGHGTENDFVLLPDPDGRLDLTPALVRAICDRRAGIGADGVLRVVRSAVAADAAAAGDAEWFMDYRNADGSVAEMCGNGIRVFARYLVTAGLAGPGHLRIATRAGVRTVETPATGDVTVDMGRPEPLGPAGAVVGGRPWTGQRVSMGNPHLVIDVGALLENVDLSASPQVEPSDFPEGVNVELVRLLADHHVAMRVHERGVGETRSCGTGVCAAAFAMASAAGETAGRWRVTVPGGELTVDLTGESALLTGPAVLVAEGELLPEALGSTTTAEELVTT